MLTRGRKNLSFYVLGILRLLEKEKKTILLKLVEEKQGFELDKFAE